MKTQIIVILVMLLVCSVFYQAMKPAIKGICQIVLQTDEEIPGMLGRIVGVETKKATLGTTLREIRSIGVLKANAEVVIKSELQTGKIVEILFTEGAEVTKDQVLIKFEEGYYKSERDKADADYMLRKCEFDRVEKLFKQKVGTQKTYDEALAAMKSAKAQLDTAIYQLSKTVIKAPFNGTIGIMKGSVSPGNIIQQQAELVPIVDNSVVKAEFMVPVKYIEDIAVGQNVEITVDAFKDRIFTGVVDAIDSEVDTRNHSIMVRAVFQNKGGALKHGMFASVKLVTGEKANVVLVDEDALDREGSIEFVWVIDDKGRAYRKRVLTGAKDMSGVEVLAGLKAGEMVVITGQLKLTDGTKTKILNKQDSGDGAVEAKDENSLEDAPLPEKDKKESNDSAKKDGGKGKSEKKDPVSEDEAQIAKSSESDEDEEDTNDTDSDSDDESQEEEDGEPDAAEDAQDKPKKEDAKKDDDNGKVKKDTKKETAKQKDDKKKEKESAGAK
ncbi:MAG: efflux RND transporter periplasmic adaptor subunit [Holosporales bacterium]|nr:efflux RND transporter periplasmic adaptor subunit [Holosporales bacterium]